MPRNEVFALIDELTLSLQNAKKMPFTDSVIVNQSQITDALKRIVTNYDPSLEKADKIITNEERILADATDSANKTMGDAQAQAQGMVSEANTYAQQTRAHADAYGQETTRQADEQARAILADARAQADELVSQTTVLARAEAQARELLENANQHAEGLRQQTQRDLTTLLEHVDAAVSVQLNEVRILKQNISAAQSFEDEEQA